MPGCRSRVALIEHQLSGFITPTEGIAYRDRIANFAPYAQISDRTGPGIALASQLNRTDLGAVAIDIDCHRIRTDSIVIVAVFPVDSEVETDGLCHRDGGIILCIAYGLGVHRYIVDLSSPDNRITVEVSRQSFKGVSPRIRVGFYIAVLLGQVDRLILFTVCQQLDINTVRIRTEAPCVCIVHPRNSNIKILLACADIILIILVSQGDIEAFAVVYVIPRSQADRACSCSVVDFTADTVVHSVLRQAFDGVFPARGSIIAPFCYRYAANDAALGIGNDLLYAVDGVSAYNSGCCIVAHNNVNGFRTVAALVIGVKPVNVSGLRTNITVTGKCDNDLVEASGRGQLNILGSSDYIISSAVLLGQLNCRIVVDLLALCRVDREVFKRPSHTVYIKVCGALVLCFINRHAVRSEVDIECFRTHAVCIVTVIKPERNRYVGNFRLIRQVQVHACGHSRIGINRIIVDADRVVDLLAAIVDVEVGEISGPHITVASHGECLANHYFAIRIQLDFNLLRTLIILIAVVIPIDGSFQTLLVSLVCQIDLDVVWVNRGGCLRHIAYCVAIRRFNNDGILDRSTSYAVVIIVGSNILPGLCPIVICIELQYLTCALAIGIQRTLYTIGTDVIIVIVVLPIDMAGNVTNGRRIIQMHYIAFQRDRVSVGILQILTELVGNIYQIDDLISVLVQRQAFHAVGPRVVIARCNGIGIEVLTLAVYLLIQFDLDRGRTLAVYVLLIMPRGIDVYRALVSLMGQLRIRVIGLVQIICGFAVCIHIGCSIADDLFLISVCITDVSTIQAILYRFLNGNRVQDLLSLFPFPVNRQVLEGILPRIRCHIARQQLRIFCTFQRLTVCIELDDYRGRADVVGVLDVIPFDGNRDILNIAVLGDINYKLVSDPSILVGTFRYVSIQVRCN